jgi:hypothetical protein
MEFNKIKKGVTGLMAVGMMTFGFSMVTLAASQSLNGGGATWYGGEDSDGILYSKLYDNKADGVNYSVTVWVTDDKGNTSQKSGTTSAVGSAGQVKVTRASTHFNPFVTEKSGYKNFVVNSTN